MVDFAKRFYMVWRNMMNRCENPNHEYYKNYGDRGIKVCDRWHTYSNFEDDMYDEYAYYVELNTDGARNKEFTLDRIDVNSNYCKENCRWVSMSVQNFNKRKKLSTVASVQLML